MRRARRHRSRRSPTVRQFRFCQRLGVGCRLGVHRLEVHCLALVSCSRVLLSCLALAVPGLDVLQHFRRLHRSRAPSRFRRRLERRAVALKQKLVGLYGSKEAHEAQSRVSGATLDAWCERLCPHGRTGRSAAVEWDQTWLQVANDGQRCKGQQRDTSERAEPAADPAERCVSQRCERRHDEGAADHQWNEMLFGWKNQRHRGSVRGANPQQPEADAAKPPMAAQQARIPEPRFLEPRFPKPRFPKPRFPKPRAAKTKPTHTLQSPHTPSRVNEGLSSHPGGVLAQNGHFGGIRHCSHVLENPRAGFQALAQADTIVLRSDPILWSGKVEFVLSTGG